jgi:putative transposase
VSTQPLSTAPCGCGRRCQPAARGFSSSCYSLRPTIEEATLAFHLRQRGATRKALRRAGRVYPRYEHTHRNAVWQGDWTQGIRIPHPTSPGKLRLTHLHVFIDDHTRYVVHGEFYFRQNLPCLEDCFRKAVLKGGRPERTYWDNGAVYQAKQIQRVAARLGTQVIFATPYHPQGKGKVERFFKTVQDAFYPEAERAALSTIDELNTFFWAWLEASYHQQVHSEIETTPHERWEAGKDNVQWPDPASLGDLFLWEEKRLVNKAGCIELGGNAYPVPEHLVGQWVSVRFDPFDLSTVRVYDKNILVGVVAPEQLVSQTFRKALPERLEKPAPLESATTYRKQLSEGYRREVAALVHQSRPDRDSNDCLTRPELAALLSELMAGRQFTVEEGSQIADFFSRYAPLSTALARKAVQRAVEEKGAQRHVRFYLDALKQGRSSRREEG